MTETCSPAPLRVALPKGRLLQPCLELFRDLGCTGLVGILSSRCLVWEEPGLGLSFMIVKPSDVPIYVEHGAADLGIVGRDVLRRSNGMSTNRWAWALDAVGW
jgi:ATP phosphoribosyltransferase